MLLVVGLAACGDSPRASRGTRDERSSSTAGATTTTAARDACTTRAQVPSGAPGLTTFVADARFATSLAWAPDGRLFFGERSGTVKVTDGRTVQTFAQVTTVTTERNGGYSERGLLGLAIGPRFDRDRFVYALFSAPDFATEQVVRWRDCAGVASAPETILTLPSSPNCCHHGGRITFSPDGALYVTVGDHQSAARAAAASEAPAQDVTDVRGKILRYDANGAVPPDNPLGAGNPAWAAGFRNVFGLAFAPDGTAFVTDNGPTGDAGSPTTGYDVAFRVRAGVTYQWPYCYGDGHALLGNADCGGRPAPEWSSERTPLVPTGATFVSASGPARMAGRFVFCTALDGMRIFVPGSPRATVESGPAGCRYDVKQGPDGALYFSDDTSIYRFL